MRKILIGCLAMLFPAIMQAEVSASFSDMEETPVSDPMTTVRYGDLDYMPAQSFKNLPELEEVIFDGFVGHIDGYVFDNCPKLKRVVFNGPVFSTGGNVFATNCGQLTEVEVNNLAFGFFLNKYPDCPSFQGIRVNGGVIYSDDSLSVPPIDLTVLKKSPELINSLERLYDWQTAHMGDSDFKGTICKSYVGEMAAILDSLNLADKAADLQACFEKNKGDFGKTKLEILKESAPYASYDGTEDLTFTYAPPTDSLLTRSREYFNLDSIAGNGDDVSRIKNLLYWVHDLVRHDGSSPWPDCPMNLVDLYNVCREQDRGLNCRFMAIMLTEALLAEGIPARYLTCQSKAFDTDPDCHVITIAWAESLGKWVWVDPTFAAFVTDENGLMLHPGEVRDRLQKDLPLVLNEDANWNHQQTQTKQGYLENYMAKNLYIISANTIQQSQPEGRSSHPQGKIIALIPAGFKYPNAHYPISDPSLFFSAPSPR